MVDDAALEKLEGGARAPRGGGKGKRGGGAPDREVLISKALSALLRHKASDAGIDLDGEGFARLDQVVSELFLGSWAPHAPSRARGQADKPPSGGQGNDE